MIHLVMRTLSSLVPHVLAFGYTPSLGTSMNTLLFRTAAQRWLRVPFAECDPVCPLCHAVQDLVADHSLVCSCGGDRTKLRNLIRNVTYHFAAGAGLNPELEKPGLIQPRP